LAGYKRWRNALARQHADEAEEILRAVGYDGDVALRVRALLLKRGLGVDDEVQTFEDAICLVFLELQLEDFRQRHDAEKLVTILQKTWAKMSPRGQRHALAMAEKRSVEARALIAAALAPR
jgi:hypothetical protein